jgi:hypothetical protein
MAGSGNITSGCPESRFWAYVAAIYEMIGGNVSLSVLVGRITSLNQLIVQVASLESAQLVKDDDPNSQR